MPDINIKDSGYIGPGRPQVGSTFKTFTLEAEAQQVLDELLCETLIPFALRVGKITKAIDAYTIHFYDSRIHTARISLTKGHSFRDLVRQAVLSRVARISGPLKK